MKKISIVVVVYEKELNELLLLLKSIDIYFDLSTLEGIHIAVQESMRDFSFMLNKLVPELFPNLSNQILIYSQLDLISDSFGRPGWYVQQALKIKTSTIIKGQYALVLDCKNHFVNHTTSADFFENELPLYLFSSEAAKFSSSSSILADNFVKAFEIFDLDYRNFIDKALGSLTPFIFRKDQLIEMVKFIKSRFANSDFYELFLTTLNTAEFYLYTAFLHKTGEYSNSIAERKVWISAVLWESNVKDMNYINWVISLIQANQVKMFGIHKNCYGKISPDVCNAIEHLWLNKNLCNEYSKYIVSQ